jgi:hypothetical protein
VLSALAAFAIVPMVQAEVRGGVLLEAEGFSQPGGWVVDQQSMDVMGSAFLLAHGMGEPVADAVTTLAFPKPGKYRLWVRTRDWAAPWKTADTHPDMRAEGTPGIFQVLVNGKAVAVTFGNEGVAWHWQDGGVVEVAGETAQIALHDLTGFAGRCDALLFSPESGTNPPPNDLATLAPLRRTLLGLRENPEEAGEFDFVVIGGGAAGCCAAVSAARLGCRVAFIHDRPVLGGNNSTEVRVGLSGLIHQMPFPRLGNLLEELGPVGYWSLQQAKKSRELPRSQEVIALFEKEPQRRIHNAGPATNYEDEKKLAVVMAEKNVTLHLSTRANGCDFKQSSSPTARVTASSALWLEQTPPMAARARKSMANHSHPTKLMNWSWAPRCNGSQRKLRSPRVFPSARGRLNLTRSMPSKQSAVIGTGKPEPCAITLQISSKSGTTACASSTATGVR